MSSRKGEIPALESSTSSGLFGVLSSPMGIIRRNISYDDLMNAPMHSPPPDFTFNILWKDPVIPQHKFRNTTEDSESGGKLLVFEPPVLEKADENLKRFEDQVQLTDTRFPLHKGPSAEETRIHRLRDDIPKLRMPSGDLKEDRLTTSAQSTPIGTPSHTPSVTPSVTPCVSPYSSPAVSRRTWFQLSPAPTLATPELNSPNSSTGMGGNEGGGERWNFFGTRSVVQKSPTDPGSETSRGFSLQSYLGIQKSSTMDGTNTQVNYKVEDPANFKPPNIESSATEAKRASPKPHKLKPRDMNILTPSGF